MPGDAGRAPVAPPGTGGAGPAPAVATAPGDGTTAGVTGALGAAGAPTAAWVGVADGAGGIGEAACADPGEGVADSVGVPGGAEPCVCGAGAFEGVASGVTDGIWAGGRSSSIRRPSTMPSAAMLPAERCRRQERAPAQALAPPHPKPGIAGLTVISRASTGAGRSFAAAGG